MAGRVVTIPAGADFLATLARGIKAEIGTNPEAMARSLVLLPTRRAARALAEAFLRDSGGAMILPRMRPIGDVEEDELAIADAASPDLPPAIAPLERLALLTRLVRARDGGAAAHAARLAVDLVALLDSLETEEISFENLVGLVDAEFAAHWQRTLDFLAVIGARWPEILRERGRVDPAARRVKLIRAVARSWADRPPDHPIYIAGSTGSIPASAELIRIVATLPRGTVILPGLDRACDEAAWAEIGDSVTHPQHGLHQLLARIDVQRATVRPWPVDQADTPRARLIATALLPPTATAAWRDAAIPDEALDGLKRIEARTAQDEALAIALALRGALEIPGKTAALVTPDRALARRVAAELTRWNIAIDDSGGIDLARTGTGTCLLLIARMAAEDFAPIPLLAALKHPLVALGGDRAASLRATRRLERRALRGLRPAPGIAGLREATDDTACRDFITALETAAAEIATLARGEADAADLMRAHLRCAEAMAPGIWTGQDGEALASFAADLLAAAPSLGVVAGREWPDLMETLMGGISVRPRFGRHPRLRILGPLEARLVRDDLVILGGLNEGTWPPEAREDPWLSRPMRLKLGLPLHERRIGQSAHDFAMAAAAPEVLLTRARKVGGTPTVASRWLQRLDAVFRTGERIHDPRWATIRDRDLESWATTLDPAPAITPPARGPLPRPPIAARPRGLSVTQIETWIRDPYAIYARHVLKLNVLDPLDAEPGAAERGSAIHAALDRFIRDHPADLPPDAEARLLNLGQALFEEAGLMRRPAWRVFWWPRFEAAARWFIGWERERRAAGIRVAASEAWGEMTIDGPGGPFTVFAKADRIDRGEGLIVLDYKTGGAPTGDQMTSGLAPQLPLEAAIAAAGKFKGVAGGAIEAIGVVRLTGRDPPGELLLPLLSKKHGDRTREAIATAIAGLSARVAAFDREATPYLSRPVPQWIKYDGDYDHLARVREWQSIVDR